MKKVLLALVVLTGCSSQGIDRAEKNFITKDFYASIKSVQQVELSSEVKSNIVGGATLGVTDQLDGNHEDMISGGIAGALKGGIFTAIFEGSNQAYQYQLHSSAEGDFALIQENLIDIKSMCAKVRLGSKVSITEAPKENCTVI